MSYKYINYRFLCVRKYDKRQDRVLKQDQLDAACCKVNLLCLLSPEDLSHHCFASPSFPASQMLPVDVCPTALAASRRDNSGQKTHPIKHC